MPSVVDRIMAPKDVLFLTPWNQNVMLYVKGELRLQMELRLLIS